MDNEGTNFYSKIEMDNVFDRVYLNTITEERITRVYNILDNILTAWKDAELFEVLKIQKWKVIFENLKLWGIYSKGNLKDLGRAVIGINITREVDNIFSNEEFINDVEKKQRESRKKRAIDSSYITKLSSLNNNELDNFLLLVHSQDMLSLASFIDQYNTVHGVHVSLHAQSSTALKGRIAKEIIGPLVQKNNILSKNERHLRAKQRGMEKEDLNRPRRQSNAPVKVLDAAQSKLIKSNRVSIETIILHERIAGMKVFLEVMGGYIKFAKSGGLMKILEENNVLEFYDDDDIPSEMVDLYNLGEKIETPAYGKINIFSVPLKMYRVEPLVMCKENRCIKLKFTGGYFLKNGTTSIRVPNEIDAKTISLEKAIELIEIKKEKDQAKKKI